MYTDNNGFISVDEMNKIVEHLFHLVPKGQKEKLETPASVSQTFIRNELVGVLPFVYSSIVL